MTARHILIAGATASGKSALALALAQRLDAVVVNADALQVYDCWQVLTARPPASDLALADHALYGHVAWDSSYSVGTWLREIGGLLQGPRPLIVVGGTGLYLTSLTRGLADIPPTPDPIRAEGDALRHAQGAEGFADYLARHDPQIWARIDRQNPMRLQRAWEVHRATGRPLSAWQADTGPAPIPATRRVDVHLQSTPHWLTPRIEQRFEQMIAEGALDEARAMLPRWTPGMPSAKALGAPELIAHLQGKIDLQTAVEKANIATRQFAKRQRTWFRSNMGDWWHIPADQASDAETIEAIRAATTSAD